MEAMSADRIRGDLRGRGVSVEEMSAVGIRRVEMVEGEVSAAEWIAQGNVLIDQHGSVYLFAVRAGKGVS